MGLALDLDLSDEDTPEGEPTPLSLDDLPPPPDFGPAAEDMVATYTIRFVLCGWLLQSKTFLK
ncbi:hypothetical protein AB2B41_20885 [Marimonas sp. MJW-29]|uniref:Uncharacterized protein n=1 Tax=Sulfitobacter sediminis TaxID=3234186 RepID=A0ABV3RSZ0_9RHOB